MDHPENSEGKGRDTLLVAKIGGNIINDETALRLFLKDFCHLKGKKILVHGGGKKATEIGEKLNIRPDYIDGRRITDKETIDLVTMVYGGLINKKVVSLLQAYGCNAIGLTGADANSIPAEKRPVKEIDYGFVGDVDSRSLPVGSWRLLLDHFTPVVAPLTHDGEGQMLNTNADTIAAVLTTALARYYNVRLVYCFEKKGVLKNINQEEIVTILDQPLYNKMIAQKTLTEGILPKLHNAFQAVAGGAESVVIGHAADIVKNAGADPPGTQIVI